MASSLKLQLLTREELVAEEDKDVMLTTASFLTATMSITVMN